MKKRIIQLIVMWNILTAIILLSLYVIFYHFHNNDAIAMIGKAISCGYINSFAQIFSLFLEWSGLFIIFFLIVSTGIWFDKKLARISALIVAWYSLCILPFLWVLGSFYLSVMENQAISSLGNIPSIILWSFDFFCFCILFCSLYLIFIFSQKFQKTASVVLLMVGICISLWVNPTIEDRFLYQKYIIMEYNEYFPLQSEKDEIAFLKILLMPKGTKVLSIMLQNSSNHRRRDAAIALGNIGGLEELEVLTIKQDDNLVMISVIEALGKIGDRVFSIDSSYNPQKQKYWLHAVSFLRSFTVNNDKKIKNAAIKSLCYLKDEESYFLLEKEEIDIETVLLIENHKLTRFIPMLSKLLEDKNTSDKIQNQIILSLSKLGHKFLFPQEKFDFEKLPALLEYIEKFAQKKDAVLIEKICLLPQHKTHIIPFNYWESLVLSALTKLSENDPQVFMPLLSSPNELVRLRAIRTIAAMNTPEVIPLLEKGKADSSQIVKIVAVGGLAKNGKANKKALALLQEMEINNTWVRYYVIWAIKQFPEATLELTEMLVSETGDDAKAFLINILGEINDKSVLPVLYQLLEKENGTGDAYISLLRAIGSIESPEKLRNFIKTQKNFYLESQWVLSEDQQKRLFYLLTKNLISSEEERNFLFLSDGSNILWYILADKRQSSFEHLFLLEYLPLVLDTKKMYSYFIQKWQQEQNWASRMVIANSWDTVLANDPALLESTNKIKPAKTPFAYVNPYYYIRGASAIEFIVK